MTVTLPVTEKSNQLSVAALKANFTPGEPIQEHDFGWLEQIRCGRGDVVEINRFNSIAVAGSDYAVDARFLSNDLRLLTGHVQACRDEFYGHQLGFAAGSHPLNNRFRRFASHADGRGQPLPLSFIDAMRVSVALGTKAMDGVWRLAYVHGAYSADKLLTTAQLYEDRKIGVAAVAATSRGRAFTISQATIDAYMKILESGGHDAAQCLTKDGSVLGLGLAKCETIVRDLSDRYGELAVPLVKSYGRLLITNPETREGKLEKVQTTARSDRWPFGAREVFFAGPSFLQNGTARLTAHLSLLSRYGIGDMSAAQVADVMIEPPERILLAINEGMATQPSLPYKRLVVRRLTRDIPVTEHKKQAMRLMNDSGFRSWVGEKPIHDLRRYLTAKQKGD